jgi:hypothetical protein
MYSEEMETSVISTRQRLLLTVLGGVSLFLVTATIYAVETSFNPFFYLVGGSRKLASITVYFYLLAILAYWSALLRVLLEDRLHIPVVVGAFLATGGVAAMGARFSGIAVDEFFLFVVGRNAWWLALGLGVVGLRPGIRLLSFPPSRPWRNWVLVGGLALGTGVLVYVIGGRTYSPALMLAKVVLILIMPIVSLLGVAIRFEKDRVLRVLAAFAALAGVAEAAIH